jgi:hypothetical protein
MEVVHQGMPRARRQVHSTALIETKQEIPRSRRTA